MISDAAKLLVRRGLTRLDLSIGRDPQHARLARTLAALDLTAVLDIGANVGQYAGLLRIGGYAGRLVSCEPLSAAYGELAARAAKDPAWTPVRTAVGAAEGTATIHVAGNSQSSSLLPMRQSHVDADPSSAIVGSEEVPVTTVRDLVDVHDLDPARTLLKVDTQGFESAVLDGAGDLLSDFAAVQLELSYVPLYDGQVLADELLTRVFEAGFAFWSIEPGFAGPDGRLLQADALLVRRDLVPAG